DGHYGLAESFRNLGEKAGALKEYDTFISLAQSIPEQAKWVAKAREISAQLRAELAAAQPAPQAQPATAPQAQAPQPQPVVTQPQPSTQQPAPRPQAVATPATRP